MKRLLKSFRFGKTFAWLRRHTSSRRNQIKSVRTLYQEIGLVESGCKLCGSKDFTLLAESDRYGFDPQKQFCNKRGLTQTHPTLSDEFLKIFYSNLYRPLYTKSTKEVDYPSLVIEQRAKGVDIVQYLSAGINDDLQDFSLIEIGCSSGGILLEAKPHFKNVQGCDLDVQGTKYARDILGLSVETSPLPSKLPDGRKIFLLSHVLEHLNHPLGVLEEIKNLMTETDFLFLIVPSMNSVKTGDYKYDLRRYFHIAHLTDFTANTLTLLGNRAGFDCLKADEKVRALFKISDSNVENKEITNKENLRNIIEIENEYIKHKFLRIFTKKFCSKKYRKISI